MNSHDPQLTPALQHMIVAGIRAGAYGHVAAEARGVSRRLFERWLKMGLRKRAQEPYAGFAVEVRSAMAQARLRAEVAVLGKDARTWLEHGPGREGRENPGWTGTVKAPQAAAGQTPSAFDDPEFLRVATELRDILSAYPQLLNQVNELLTRPPKSSRNGKPSPSPPPDFLPDGGSPDGRET